VLYLKAMFVINNIEERKNGEKSEANSDTERENGDDNEVEGQKDGWMPLSKARLKEYAQSIGYCQDCTSNQLGSLFENIFEQYGSHQQNLVNDQFARNTTPYVLSPRTTVPDFTANANVWEDGVPIGLVPNGVWFELKAKYGGLYESSNTYQIRGHIDNLYVLTLAWKARYPEWIPALHIVTTSDVTISSGIYRYAEKRVEVQHHVAQYRIINGEYEFDF